MVGGLYGAVWLITGLLGELMVVVGGRVGGERLRRISLRLGEGNRDPVDVEETSAFALAIIGGYSCLRQGGPSGGNRSPKGGCASRSGGT